MLKVVIDTNVVISSAISQEGNPSAIFEMILKEEIKNYTTQEIIEEIKEVFERPRIMKIINSSVKYFIINNFEIYSEIVRPEIKINKIKDDPDDDKFLECALCSSVDYIISGDEHLLKLKDFRQIRIVSPAEFINIIKKDITYF